MALKNVTVNEPFFQGHFPHYAVMPGVLIIEAMAQAAAMLSLKTIGHKNDGKWVYYFVGIDDARFKRPVVPGDQLRARGRAAASVAPRHGQVHGRGARSATQLAAEAELLCALRPSSPEGETP